MKKLTKISVLAFAVFSFTFISCTSQPAENTSPDDMIEGADGNLDSANLATEGDTVEVK